MLLLSTFVVSRKPNSHIKPRGFHLGFFSCCSVNYCIHVKYCTCIGEKLKTPETYSTWVTQAYNRKFKTPASIKHSTSWGLVLPTIMNLENGHFRLHYWHFLLLIYRRLQPPQPNPSSPGPPLQGKEMRQPPSAMKQQLKLKPD